MSRVESMPSARLVYHVDDGSGYKRAGSATSSPESHAALSAASFPHPEDYAVQVAAGSTSSPPHTSKAVAAPHDPATDALFDPQKALVPPPTKGGLHHGNLGSGHKCPFPLEALSEEGRQQDNCCQNNVPLAPTDKHLSTASTLLSLDPRRLPLMNAAHANTPPAAAVTSSPGATNSLPVDAPKQQRGAAFPPLVAILHQQAANGQPCREPPARFDALHPQGQQHSGRLAHCAPLQQQQALDYGHLRDRHQGRDNPADHHGNRTQSSQQHPHQKHQSNIGQLQSSRYSNYAASVNMAPPQLLAHHPHQMPSGGHHQANRTPASIPSQQPQQLQMHGSMASWPSGINGRLGNHLGNHLGSGVSMQAIGATSETEHDDQKHGTRPHHQQQALYHQQLQPLSRSHPPPTNAQHRVLGEQTWLHIAKLAQVMNDVKRAINALEMAFRCNPTSFLALNTLGPLLLQRGHYEQAAEVFQRLLTLNAQRLEWWSALGYCWLAIADYVKSLDAFQQALRLDGSAKDALLWFRIGLFYDCQGSNDAALESFLTALKIYELQADGASIAAAAQPAFVRDLYFRVGILYRMRGEYRTSIECFEYLLSAPPPQRSKADVVLQLAIVQEEWGELDVAASLLEQLLSQQHPKRTMAQARQLLGCVMLRLRRFDVAMSLLSKAREEDPSDVLTQYYIGRLFATTGQHAVAFDAFQQAILGDARNVAFWNAVGLLYFEARQYRDALDAYSRAVHLEPLRAELWWNLGQLYEAGNGRGADALEAFVRARRLLLQQLSANGTSCATADTLKRELGRKLDDADHWLASGEGAPGSTHIFELNPRHYALRSLCLATPLEQKPLPYLPALVNNCPPS